MATGLGPFTIGDHWIIVGVPQSGKTVLALRLVKACRRVVYFDPRAEYEARGEPIKPSDLRSDHFAGEWLRLTIQANRNSEIDPAVEFVHSSRIVRDGARIHGSLVYVCDEIGDYAAGAMRTLRQIHANGHKDGVVSLFVSQRAVDLPLGCRATATRVLSLLQTHPTDLQRLEDEFGPEMRSAAQAWRPYSPPAVWTRPRLWK